MGGALERHDAIVRGGVEAASGYVFSTGGDGFGVAFGRADQAVAAAAAIQRGAGCRDLAGRGSASGADGRAHRGGRGARR